MSRNQRLAFAAVAAVIAIVAVVALASSGGNDSSTPASGTGGSAEPQIVVKGGAVQGGVQQIDVKKGDHIRFSVTSDQADEVHVHGYNVKKDVAAGSPVHFDIPATIRCISEVEIENAKVQLASLRVEQ